MVEILVALQTEEKTAHNTALSATATVFQRKFWCLGGKIVALNNTRQWRQRLGWERYTQHTPTPKRKY